MHLTLSGRVAGRDREPLFPLSLHKMLIRLRRTALLRLSRHSPTLYLAATADRLLPC